MKYILYTLLFLLQFTAALAQPCNETLTATANDLAPCTGTELSLFANTIAGTTYSWTGPDNFSSNQQNPQIASMTLLKGGTYIVTATAGACIYTDDIFIDLRLTPIMPVILPDTACEGDSVDILVFDNSSASQYYLIDPFNNIHHTIGQVTLKMVTGTYHAYSQAGNGCFSDTTSMLITSAPKPDIQLFILGKPACKGDSIILRPYHTSGAYEYMFWNPKDERINAYLEDAKYSDNGTYKCVIINTYGCVSDTAKINVVVQQTIVPGVAIYANEQAGPFGKITFTSYVSKAGKNPVYRWFKNGNSIPNATSDTYIAINGTDVKPGDEILLQVTADTPTCPGTGISNTIIPATDLAVNDTRQNSFTIYPNPNNGTFTIADIPDAEDGYSISIINSIGQEIFTDKANTTSYRMDKILPAGIYTISLHTITETVYSKLIIQQ